MILFYVSCLFCFANAHSPGVISWAVMSSLDKLAVLKRSLENVTRQMKGYRFVTKRIDKFGEIYVNYYGTICGAPREETT